MIDDHYGSHKPQTGSFPDKAVDSCRSSTAVAGQVGAQQLKTSPFGQIAGCALNPTGTSGIAVMVYSKNEA